MGRPKSKSPKARMTVLLSVENDDFVRQFAENRAINLSTAMNVILSAVIKGNYESLREASMEFSARRQF